MGDTKLIAVLLAILSVLATTSAADKVVLESFDESFRLDGFLETYDGEVFTVRSAFGPVTLRASDVRCTGAACPEIVPPRRDFRISGSRDLASDLMPSLVEAFSFELDADMTFGTSAKDVSTRMTLESYDGATLADISFIMAGSTQGVQHLAEGTASMALTSRPLRAEELEAVAETSPDGTQNAPLETVLALDGVVVVTSRKNPVRALTQEMIAEVFAGNIDNWADLGGPDAPITVYAPRPSSGTGEAFSALVLDPAEARLSPGITILESDAAVSDSVARDPLAIGFTSFSNQRGARALSILGECGIQTPPTPFTIKTEEYPLTQRLYLYRKDSPLPEPAEAFLGFVGSESAQGIIARAGFVDQGISSVSVNNMGLRFVASLLPGDVDVDIDALRGMTEDLVAAERLSITLRFDEGSTRLDARAEKDVQRLAEMIRDGRFENKEVLLVGFTDSAGPAAVNASLSQSRAEQVADTLIDQLPVDLAERDMIRALGYGEMSPLACNDTATDRQINRRVEVWTRDLVR
ncbi:MAG: phosphate ABC transporter substrate-binding/OmpA family protein [Pseudomonadota bacterium]